MDKLKFVLIAAFLAVTGLKAQVTIDGYVFDNLPYVANVCYDVEYREKVKVTDGVSVNTMTIFDKLKFKQKNYKNAHQEYLDGDGNTTHDVVFVSHENMFPQWYSHPILIRTAKSGTSSFFAGDNQYLTDGWTGGHMTTTEHGEYIKDPRTGEQYLSHPHSDKAQQYYDQYSSLVERHGFLYKHAFKYPSASTLQQLQNSGYLVSNQNNTIVVQNQSVNLIWDLTRTMTIRQYLEGGAIVRTVYSHYTYNQFFDSYIIVKTITVTPQTFDNGDCFERVDELVYTNFSTSCSNAHLTQNSSETESINIQSKNNQATDLSFYPNPTSGDLVVEIPDPNTSALLTVFNLSGSKLLVRKINSGERQYILDLSNLPGGMYTVQLTQGSYNYSSKLAKQ